MLCDDVFYSVPEIKEKISVNGSVKKFLKNMKGFRSIGRITYKEQNQTK